MVWHDIWDGIGTANLAADGNAESKFDQIADWQGCRAEDLCMRWAAREAAAPGPSAWAQGRLLLYLTATVQTGMLASTG